MIWIRNKDVLIGLFFLLFSISLYFYTMGFAESSNEYTKIGTGFIPRLLSFLLAFLSTGLIIQGIKSKKVISWNFKKVISENLNLLITIMLCIIYIVGLGFVGFLPSTLLFLLCLLFLNKIRKPLMLLSIPFGVTTVIYWIFTSILNVPLP